MDIRRFFGLAPAKVEDNENTEVPTSTPISLGVAPVAVDQSPEAQTQVAPAEVASSDPVLSCDTTGNSKRKRNQRSSTGRQDDVEKPKNGAASTPKTAKGRSPKQSKAKSSATKRKPAVKLVKDPRLAKLTKVDARMLSKRRLRDPVEDTPYDMELVPKVSGCSLRPWTPPTSTSASCLSENGHVDGADDGGMTHSDSTSARSEPPPAMLAGSVLVRVSDREIWSRQVTELLQLCSEAAWRRCEADRIQSPGASSSSSSSAAAAAASPQPPLLAPPDAKPLMLEYIADRLDTDDPTWGYQVRHASTGWLQGFILLTDFTTWSWYFRFDSEAPSNGITCDDFALRVTDRGPSCSSAASSSNGSSSSSSSNGSSRGTGGGEGMSLASLLEREPRYGDPEQEGVVFDRVAEVSLLGAFGCGAWLLRLALQELAASGKYRYAILQATDQAIPFYEAMGFVRVGCVARHAKGGEDAAEEKRIKKQQEQEERNGNAAHDCPDSAGKSPAKKKKKKSSLLVGTPPESSGSPNSHEIPYNGEQTQSLTPASSSSSSSSSGGGGSIRSPPTPSQCRILEGLPLLNGTVLEPPQLPEEWGGALRHPEDGYYWLSLWLAHLCQRFKAADAEQVFHHPVDLGDPVAQAEYLLMIPQPPVPMDLSTMLRKAINHRYEDLKGLVADLHALVNNSLAYNQSNSPIYKLAKKLRTDCLALVRAFLAEVPAAITTASRTHAANTATTSKDGGNSSSSGGGGGGREERVLEWDADCWVVPPPEWKDSVKKPTCSRAATGAGFPPKASGPTSSSSSSAAEASLAHSGWGSGGSAEAANEEEQRGLGDEEAGEAATTMTPSSGRRGKKSSSGRKRSRQSASPQAPIGAALDAPPAADGNEFTGSGSDNGPETSAGGRGGAAGGAGGGGDVGGINDVGGGAGVESRQHRAHLQWLRSAEGVAFQQRLKAAADRDTGAVFGYVHWTFPDQAVEDQYPSYMMVRSLFDLMPLNLRAAVEREERELDATATVEGKEEEEEDDSAASSSSSSGVGVGIEAALVGVSPEVAGGFPRGVTPRGANSFVAKIGASDGYDYLGSFPTVEDARVAYEEARAELDAKLEERRRRQQQQQQRASGSVAAAATQRTQRSPAKARGRRGSSGRGGSGGGAAAVGGEGGDGAGESGTSGESCGASLVRARSVCPSVDLWGNVARWLVPEAPPVTPQRMAWGEGARTPQARQEQQGEGTAGSETSGNGAVRVGSVDAAAAAASASASTCAEEEGQEGATTPTASSSEPAASEAGQDAGGAAAKKRKTAGGGARGADRKKLYNKLVTVIDQPPVYPHRYWFVYQYVPDMQWCHLCPVEQDGVFKGHGARGGRPRYKLVPEGRAREIDVPASRCVLVPSKQTLYTTSADEEVFDILDPLPVG